MLGVQYRCCRWHCVWSSISFSQLTEEDVTRTVGRGAGFEFASCAWCGEASCGLPEWSSTEMDVPGSPNVASKMIAKSFYSLVSVGVAHQRGVQCEISSGRFWPIHRFFVSWTLW